MNVGSTAAEPLPPNKRLAGAGSSAFPNQSARPRTITRENLLKRKHHTWGAGENLAETRQVTSVMRGYTAKSTGVLASASRVPSHLGLARPLARPPEALENLATTKKLGVPSRFAIRPVAPSFSLGTTTTERALAKLFLAPKAPKPGVLGSRVLPGGVQSGPGRPNAFRPHIWRVLNLALLPLRPQLPRLRGVTAGGTSSAGEPRGALLSIVEWRQQAPSTAHDYCPTSVV